MVQGHGSLKDGGGPSSDDLSAGDQVGAVGEEGKKEFQFFVIGPFVLVHFTFFGFFYLKGSNRFGDEGETV